MEEGTRDIVIRYRVFDNDRVGRRRRQFAPHILGKITFGFKAPLFCKGGQRFRVIVARTPVDLSRREVRAIEQDLRFDQQGCLRLGRTAPCGIVDGIRIESRALRPALDQQEGRR